MESNPTAASDLDQIRALVHGYCDAVCCNDHAAFASTWTEDGRWEIGRGPVVGRDAIATAFTTAMDLFESVIQLAHNGTAVIDGEQGRGRWYMTEYSRTRTGRNLLYVGAYSDTYRRTPDGWCFASRSLSWFYQGAPDLTGSFGPPPGYDLPAPGVWPG
jgi:ketosteroid isomerase-like protein